MSTALSVTLTGAAANDGLPNAGVRGERAAFIAGKDDARQAVHRRPGPSQQYGWPRRVPQGALKRLPHNLIRASVWSFVVVRFSRPLPTILRCSEKCARLTALGETVRGFQLPHALLSRQHS